MSQTLCNNIPVTTKEGILDLLKDKGGAQYYSQMKEMKVDQEALARDLEKPVNPARALGSKSVPTALCVRTVAFFTKLTITTPSRFLPAKRERPRIIHAADSFFICVLRPGITVSPVYL